MLKIILPIENFVFQESRKHNKEYLFPTQEFTHPITICVSECLPPKLYSLMLEASNLPPIFEGANTTNERLCLANKLLSVPYISFDTRNTGFYPTFAGVHDRTQERCNQMVSKFKFDYFNYEDDFKNNANDIAHFIIDALNPDSSLNQYFLMIARKLLNPENNLTTIGYLL